ncbi:NAD-dependent epimerase/dehydratase family protein [Thioalkalivibrio paradoxus]|uniref:Epimerase n=1 Tax=Thioalkalivibrio paradoxus ARh 1 TaxID=713585 RepID=W0DIW1_9GAMM|nr:NAD-dependent epimerase/dehydratase family protein [Thioalkalivibrio paradoxus]AHE98549.1 epimerase [Thioalkalivibrio paradoxus ARh 1]
MNRVLVTGAAGVVGHFLLPRLVAAGLEVHALSRVDRFTEGVCWHRGDLEQPTRTNGLPPADAAVHLAPIWLLPPILPRLRELGVRRLIAFSSTSALTKADSASVAERALAQRLVDAEARVAGEAGYARWTICRPTLIYGAGRDRNVSEIARFVHRFGFFPVAGRGSGLRQPVHAADLADACLTALAPESPACGRTLNLVGGETLGYREMVVRVFQALGRRPRVVHLPAAGMRGLIAALATLPRFRHLDAAMVERMDVDMAFDPEPARGALGFAPRPFFPQREDLGLTGDA